MASTRLTNTVRDQIWERLERHAFQERRDALQRQFESLANEAYLRFIGSQEGFTKATFIGHGWVGKRKSFLVKLGDHCREVAAPKQELVVAGSLNKNLCLPAEKK